MVEENAHRKQDEVEEPQENGYPLARVHSSNVPLMPGQIKAPFSNTAITFIHLYITVSLVRF